MSNPIIEKYEGLHLIAYQDDAGIWTIGRGTTVYPDNSVVKKGDVCTNEQAEAYINYHCTNRIKIPEGVSRMQRDAIEALIYNIGQYAFDKSSLKKGILKGDLHKIFKNWDWISVTIKDEAGRKYKKALRGLCKRRAEELLSFMSEEVKCLT